MGERVTWKRPITLTAMLELKEKNPDAKIVVGNTEIGKILYFAGMILK